MCGFLRTEVVKLRGCAPWWVLLVVRGDARFCVRDIFILNEIWEQDEIHVLVGTLLG
jgi:hypothetical protein